MGERERYEHKTVMALRGTDRMVVAKWEKRGWELSDQTPGTMRTELTFRRAKPRVTRQAWAIGAVAVLCAGAITVGALTETDEKDDPPRASSSSTDDETADIDDFLAALERGDLEDYAQGHNADLMEFDAKVTGVTPQALKAVEFINLRAVVDGKGQGPLLKLVWGGFSRIPFPTELQRGDDVRVRATIDWYLSDDEVWLSPDDEDSFIRVRSPE